LVVLSGKGGTGKTILTASLAHLAHEDDAQTLSCSTVLVDADVDAANLALILNPELICKEEFWGGSVAEIDTSRCQRCGTCENVCRFDAVRSGIVFSIDSLACDGCGACVFACLEAAIRMIPEQDGEWYHSNTAFGPLFHAELFPGRENSGKLVTRVKQNARLYAIDHQIGLSIIDGPPGIGCPVISASAGVDLALVVTEPSVSGLHDLQRILAMLSHFKIKALICLNKADLYPPARSAIHDYAQEAKIPLVAEIPYDPAVPAALFAGLPVTRFAPESPASQAIRSLWQLLRSEWLPNEVFHG
jgi:MinD superfamily P-loop ATPase